MYFYNFLLKKLYIISFFLKKKSCNTYRKKKFVEFFYLTLNDKITIFVHLVYIRFVHIYYKKTYKFFYKNLSFYNFYAKFL